jgi:hypothetical protein
MPEKKALTLSDVAGRLGVLRVECARCAEAGHYLTANLMHEYGRDAKLSTILANLTANCPRRRPTAPATCEAGLPDLAGLRI